MVQDERQSCKLELNISWFMFIDFKHCFILRLRCSEVEEVEALFAKELAS